MSRLVAPSLLSADFSKLGDELKRLEMARADWAHVDVMDGHFVPNLTLGAPIVKSLRKVTKLPLDVHLMIEKPENLLNDFLDAGSDVITIHVESTQKASQILEKIRKSGRKAGITLKPGTELQKIEDFLPLVDLVLVMTVEPGFGGQEFLVSQVSKIERLRKFRIDQGLSYLIEVDGGVNEKTLPQVHAADVLVAGSYVFKHSDYSVPILRLKAN